MFTLRLWRHCQTYTQQFYGFFVCGQGIYTNLDFVKSHVNYWMQISSPLLSKLHKTSTAGRDVQNSCSKLLLTPWKRIGLWRHFYCHIRTRFVCDAMAIATDTSQSWQSKQRKDLETARLVVGRHSSQWTILLACEIKKGFGTRYTLKSSYGEKNLKHVTWNM